MKRNLNENISLDSQSSSKNVSVGSIHFSTWPLRSKTVKQMMCKHLWRAATDSPEPIFIIFNITFQLICQSNEVLAYLASDYNFK